MKKILGLLLFLSLFNIGAVFSVTMDDIELLLEESVGFIGEKKYENALENTEIIYSALATMQLDENEISEAIFATKIYIESPALWHIGETEKAEKLFKTSFITIYLNSDEIDIENTCSDFTDLIAMYFLLDCSEMYITKIITIGITGINNRMANHVFLSAFLSMLNDNISDADGIDLEAFKLFQFINKSLLTVYDYQDPDIKQIFGQYQNYVGLFPEWGIETEIDEKIEFIKTDLKNEGVSEIASFMIDYYYRKNESIKNNNLGSAIILAEEAFEDSIDGIAKICCSENRNHEYYGNLKDLISFIGILAVDIASLYKEAGIPEEIEQLNSQIINIYYKIAEDFLISKEYKYVEQLYMQALEISKEMEPKGKHPVHLHTLKLLENIY